MYADHFNRFSSIPFWFSVGSLWVHTHSNNKFYYYIFILRTKCPQKSPNDPIGMHLHDWFRKKDCVILRLRQHFHTTFSLNSPTFISTFLEEGRAYSLVPYYVILDSKSSKNTNKINHIFIIVNVEVHS